MIPVVLVTIPTLDQVVGTFDIDSFESWWISDPFPGEIRDIADVFWGHGDYHFAIVEMVDESWSLYRSNNCGRRWAEIWNLESRIFGALKVDTTWYLFPTADGWYETTNTGATIAKISDTSMEAGRGVPLGSCILYHTGSKIWRSENLARDWDVAVDCDTIWAGLRSPAISGNPGMVVAGVGPVLLRSFDEGDSWTVAHRLASNRIIRDIFPLNPVAGPDCPYLVQVELVSEDKFRYFVVSEQGTVWTPKWDRAVSPERTLTGYRVAVPIVGGEDELYFAGGSKFDPKLGRYVPSMRWSRDGEDWTEIDLEKTHTSPSTPFLVATWTTRVWNGPACHNWGHWVYTNHFRWALSWDMGMTSQNAEIKGELDVGALVVARPEEELDSTAALMKTFPVPVPSNVPVQAAIPKGRAVRVAVQAEIPEPVEVGGLVVLRHPVPLPVSVPLLKEVPRHLNLFCGVQAESSRGAGVGAFFVKTLFDGLLVDAEHYFPQWWNLHCPPRPWRVFDSRQETYG